jgi:hypothetical protein
VASLALFEPTAAAQRNGSPAVFDLSAKADIRGQAGDRKPSTSPGDRRLRATRGSRYGDSLDSQRRCERAALPKVHSAFLFSCLQIAAAFYAGMAESPDDSAEARRDRLFRSLVRAQTQLLANRRRFRGNKTATYGGSTRSIANELDARDPVFVMISIPRSSLTSQTSLAPASR